MKKGSIAVLSALAGSAAGLAAGAVSIGKLMKTGIKDKNELSEKMISYYGILNHWLSLSQKGRSLSEYFEDKGYKRVAIYGMKELGERLFDELKHSGIEVVCIIDQNPSGILAEAAVLHPDDQLPEVDAVVVTASYYFDTIRKEMQRRVECPVLSIGEIVYGM